MASLTKFLNAFSCTEDRLCGDVSQLELSLEPSVSAVVAELGGKSFDGGAYRVPRADEILVATAAAKLAFPELAERIIAAFGYDWLGRAFAADSGRLLDGVPQVLMLEFGAGEAMQVPASVTSFHEEELVEYADDALAMPFLEQWRAVAPSPLRHNQCVGYKVPLFLGGPDTVNNLELSDLSVYWHLCGQLRASLQP